MVIAILDDVVRFIIIYLVIAILDDVERFIIFYLVIAILDDVVRFIIIYLVIAILDDVVRFIIIYYRDIQYSIFPAEEILYYIQLYQCLNIIELVFIII